MIPILFTGVHGASQTPITAEMVKSAWRRGQGRKIPIVAGHPNNDPPLADEKALGAVTLERFVEPYVDECGVKRDMAILGRVELNARGKSAVREQDYFYYSPALKRDQGAGYIMRHVGLVNDPAQAGLPALQDMVVLADAGLMVELYDKAPENEAWTFSAADYDVKQLARASAFVDGVAGNPHTAAIPEDLAKSACHLPHHKPDGTLVWRGVVAAAGALAGARGGVNLSEDAKKQAHAHLAKHYGEFGRQLGDDGMPDVKLFDEQSLEQMKTMFQESLTAALAPLMEKLVGTGEPSAPADKGDSTDNAEMADLRKQVVALSDQLGATRGEVTASKFLADAVSKGCPQKQAVILAEMVKSDPKVLPNAVKLADEAAAAHQLMGGITLNLSDADTDRMKADREAGAAAGSRVV